MIKNILLLALICSFPAINAEEVHGKIDIHIKKDDKLFSSSVNNLTKDHYEVCTVLGISSKFPKNYSTATACGTVLKISEGDNGCRRYSLNLTVDNLYTATSSGSKFVAVAQFYVDNQSTIKFLNAVYCPNSKPDTKNNDIVILKNKNIFDFVSTRNIEGYAFG
ncbi:MAG: hypothetical protein SFW66_08650 [Gammaproteobacteria bacterium]|nr:hypothetical protein [Gammaproteobacteria bacterium]